MIGDDEFLSLKEDIRQFASEQGIDMLGFASPEPFISEQEILLEKKSMGLLSPFEEQDIEIRCNPDRILPGVKTIISCAMGYLTEPDSSSVGTHPFSIGAEEKHSGRLSRYAGVQDYHNVLGGKLQKVADFISLKKPHRYIIMADTGSLMDKAVAVRAGLGWIGENTCLFTPKYGSWVFLGEILTDLFLKPDSPMESQCDHCGRCVKACPTGALMSPYRINPHRCLSYITQIRGDIPEEFKKSLGDRVFGCDTCQEVCPKNKTVNIPNHPEFRSEVSLRQKLSELMYLGKNDFDRFFRVTAAGWRGRNTLRRNALCAAANLKDSGLIPHIEGLMQDPSEIVRNQAGWALERLRQS